MDGAGPSSWPILGTTTPRGYQNPEKINKKYRRKKSRSFCLPSLLEIAPSGYPAFRRSPRPPLDASTLTLLNGTFSYKNDHFHKKMDGAPSIHFATQAKYDLPGTQ